jgi:hypothetical protein
MTPEDALKLLLSKLDECGILYMIAMAAQKKFMTKGQIVTNLAGKFEISKKAAASVIDEYAAPAIAETKKKGPLCSLESADPSSSKERLG